MATIDNIYKYCDACKGTGKVISPSSLDKSGGSPDCPVCNGLGKILFGFIEKEDE